MAISFDYNIHLLVYILSSQRSQNVARSEIGNRKLHKVLSVWVSIITNFPVKGYSG